MSASFSASPLDVQRLRAIWHAHPSPIVRALLWEIRRLREENARLRKVVAELEGFEVAVLTRGALNGDVQLLVFWNRVRAACGI